MADGAQDDELIEVGTFERPHGVRGEIAFHTGEAPDPPFPYASLVVVEGSGTRRLVVASARTKMDRWLLTIEGIASPEAARALSGKRASVPYSWLPPPPEGSMYLHDVVGMTLHDARMGADVGTVKEVRRLAGRDYLDLGDDQLVPLVPELVASVDRTARRIVMNLPSGLLDLGGPTA